MQQIGIQDKVLANQLLDRMADRDYRGLDPSIVIHAPRRRRLESILTQTPFVNRVLMSIASRTFFYGGHRVNAMLDVPVKRFAKGMALCVSAYAAMLNECDETDAQSIRNRVGHLFSLIESKRLASGLWAHDCDYAIQGVPVTTRTPNLVTSAFVANGYWDWWQASGSQKYKESFVDIAKRMLDIFPAKQDGETLCFMYTPVTEYHVHNANLLMAEVLAKWQSIDDCANQEGTIKKSLIYSLNDFRESAGFPYAGPPSRNHTADNYHTGYVLRSLDAVQRFLPDLAAESNVFETIRVGIEFYLKSFIKNKYVWFGEYRMIESHSLAESIIFFKVFARFISSPDRKRLVQAIQNTASRLWNDNYFINNTKFLPLGIRLSDQTDMIRWSQAWMAYALAFMNIYPYEKLVGEQ